MAEEKNVKKEKKKTDIKIKDNKLMQRLWVIGAIVIEKLDIWLDKALEAAVKISCAAWEEIKEILIAGEELAYEIGADVVTGYDHLSDIVEWAVKKSIVLFFRKLHGLRMEVARYKREILRICIYFLVSAVVVIFLFASATDYEYSYNGRSLGVVREQKDVLEILELVSEELSLEYGSNIYIDPENDIKFKPVISYGREIDDMDDVLRKFTYMGDIQATAYALVVDGQTLAVLESEDVAESVLESIKNAYLKGDDTEYEYVGFAEDVKIEQVNTTLSGITSKSAAIKKIKNGGQQEVVYKVKSGDTIYGICEKLGVSLKELKEMNPGLDVDDTLHIGDKFVTQKEVPLLTVETVEVSTFAEAIDYKTEYKESSSYYVGDSVVSRAGKKGKARVTARLTKQNGEIVEREDLKVVTITEPVNKIVVKGTKPVPPKKGTGTFIRPVNVSVYRGYGMRWGRMHYGLDYAAPTGTSIYASDGGTVITSGWHVNYGYYIKIDHGANKVTLYAHCSKMYVKAGDKVFQGQKIGAVGNTGRSTGPHCHFELFVNGKNVNPAKYL